MLNRYIATACVATALFSVASAVQSQTTSTSTSTSTTTAESSESSSRLVGTYTPLAGSKDNADALVQGLRTGSSVTLTPVGIQPLGVGPVTFKPATSSMGLGEVNIALSLAKAELGKLGITNPTPAQLQAALNGGSITTADGKQVTLKGVLADRAAGMGWGQIANAMGVKLGALVSASKTEHAGKKEHASESEKDSAMTASAAAKAKAEAARGKSDGGAGSGNGGGNGGGHGGGGNGGGGNGGKK